MIINMLYEGAAQTAVTTDDITQGKSGSTNKCFIPNTSNNQRIYMVVNTFNEEADSTHERLVALK